MNDYIYDAKAVALDNKLESVLESFKPTAPATKEAQQSTLRAYAERPSIAEEIAVVRGKTAAVDFNVKRAAEVMDSIIEDRTASTLELRDLLRQAAEKTAAELEESEALEAHREVLRGTR